jgi:hypothetical protein
VKKLSNRNRWSGCTRLRSVRLVGLFRLQQLNLQTLVLNQTGLESVNEFTDWMKSTLEEAKAALAQSKDDMARYYNQNRTKAPEYKPGDKVYLDASDVQTNRSSRKLSHRHLKPFQIERRVGNSAYRLRLPLSMKHLHPVFNVVELTPAPTDPIAGRHFPPPPLPEIVDGEEEWVVEEILDSKVINRKLWYLVKWKENIIPGNPGTMFMHLS